MKQTLWIFFIFLGTAILQHSNTAKAHDFGTHSHTFEILEPDLLKQIEGKLQTLKKSGELSKHNTILTEKTKKALYSPEPVKGITKAKEDRTFTYDPSIIVPYDLKDHEGKVFHKAGAKINPLQYKSLPALLVFIDGNDEAHLKFVETTYLKSAKTQKSSKFPKIILTSGSPFQLMEQWNPLIGGQPVYFDQGGRLIGKLGIKHVPAVVTQEGLNLKITEFALKQDSLKEDTR